MMDGRTFVLADEREQLDKDLDELADKILNADDPAALKKAAANIETKLSGVAYLIETYGEGAEVKCRGLTAGEYAQIEDQLAAMRAEADGGELPGAKSNLFAAAGVVNAPFMDEHDPHWESALDTIAEQPVGVARWLFDKVNEATNLQGNGYRSLNERLAAKVED